MNAAKKIIKAVAALARRCTRIMVPVYRVGKALFTRRAIRASPGLSG